MLKISIQVKEIAFISKQLWSFRK